MRQSGYKKRPCRQRPSVPANAFVPLLLLALFPWKASAWALEASREEPFTWEFHWDEGLHYQKERRIKVLDRLEERRKGGSETGILRAPLPEYRVKGKIGGKLQVDAAAFLENGDLEGFSDGIEVRRFRLYTKGDFFLLIPIAYDLDFGVIKASSS